MVSESYVLGYDIWANLLSATVTKCSAPMLSVGVTAQNKINNTGFSYDAAGNLTGDGSFSYTWDAGSRMKSAAGVNYTYDGDGKRAKKSNGKLYWYGMGSDALTETDLSGTPSADYIFFNGKRTARLDLPSATVHYYFSDHLGSASVITSSTGAIQDESDYYPFGGERTVTNTDPNQYKFTGKERDTETGLDYFGARYYGSNMGRFLSVDPVAGNVADPQSLNRYTYTLNNPLKFIDPTGMVVEWADSEKKKKKGEAEARTNAQRGYENRIAKLLASKNAQDRAKGQQLAATYQRLQDSKAVFRVVPESASNSSGRISFDGSVFTISLKGDASAYGAITQNQKVAHEFEHGRQILDQELSFENYKPPAWNPFAYDRTDEAKAFSAGFDAEPANPSQGAFIQGMSRALQGGLQSGVEYLQRSGSTYRNLPAGPINVQHKSPAIYEVPK